MTSQIRSSARPSAGTEGLINKSKKVRDGMPDVPAPRSASPAGHEEIEAQVIKDISPARTRKTGNPPKPRSPKKPPKDSS